MWLLSALLLPGCSGAPAAPAEVFVVVAARDLSVGVPIGEQDVYGLKMDVRYVPDDVFLDPTAVLGRVPAAKILANEPIRGRRLADGELQRMVEDLVPRDKRVVTVPLAPEVAVEPVAGRDLVDVWVVTGGARARVLEQVTFLRIDHRSVALTLTDPQAADLENARAAGEVLVIPSAAAPVEFRPSP